MDLQDPERHLARTALLSDGIYTDLWSFRFLFADFDPEIRSLQCEILLVSLALQDLYDVVPLWRRRMTFVADDWRMLLPVVEKTLMDMKALIADIDRLGVRITWRVMHDQLSVEGGQALAMRFIGFREYMVQIKHLLTRLVPMQFVFTDGTLRYVDRMVIVRRHWLRCGSITTSCEKE